MPGRMPERMSECMPERMSEEMSKKYFQMVCQKLQYVRIMCQAGDHSKKTPFYFLFGRSWNTDEFDPFNLLRLLREEDQKVLEFRARDSVPLVERKFCIVLKSSSLCSCFLSSPLFDGGTAGGVSSPCDPPRECPWSTNSCSSSWCWATSSTSSFVHGAITGHWTCPGSHWRSTWTGSKYLYASNSLLLHRCS